MSAMAILGSLFKSSRNTGWLRTESSESVSATIVADLPLPSSRLSSPKNAPFSKRARTISSPSSSDSIALRIPAVHDVQVGAHVRLVKDDLSLLEQDLFAPRGDLLELGVLEVGKKGDLFQIFDQHDFPGERGIRVPERVPAPFGEDLKVDKQLYHRPPGKEISA